MLNGAGSTILDLLTQEDRLDITYRGMEEHEMRSSRHG